MNPPTDDLDLLLQRQQLFLKNEVDGKFYLLCQRKRGDVRARAPEGRKSSLKDRSERATKGFGNLMQ